MSIVTLMASEYGNETSMPTTMTSLSLEKAELGSKTDPLIVHSARRRRAEVARSGTIISIDSACRP